MSDSENSRLDTYRVNPRTDKPRNGMLTEAQRTFLESDESGYTAQNRYDYREAIKDRVFNTFLDFSILFEHWGEGEREEVFWETFEGAPREGLASLLAMIYLESRFESGMGSLLFHAVNKAESEMGDSDLVFSKNVEFSVSQIEQTDLQQAIEKFRSRKLSDMSNSEAQAIIRVLDRTPLLNADDVELMRDEMFDFYEDLADLHGEARAERAKSAREKQGRFLSWREEEE